MITPTNSIYFLFLTILLCNLAENTNIKEISNAQIDHFYANLFGLSSDEDAKHFKKSNEKVGNLSLPEIESAIFYNDINEMFKLAKQTKNLNKNQKDLLDKKLIEFEQIITDSQNSTAIVKSCEIWKFWHEIYNVFAKHKILEAKMNVFVQKHSKSINYETIDCNKMEESLKSGEPINKSVNHIEEFLNNQKWLHYNVIVFLITNSTEPNKQIQLGNNFANAKQNWKLIEYFGHTKLNDESEFAYKMRTLRTKNVVIVNTIKSKIEKIIGENLLEELEFQQPLLMSFDIIDEEKLAQIYVQMVSADQKLSENAELRLSIRMLFGRILDLFTNVYAIKKTTKNKQKREFFAEFEEYWNKTFMKILQQFTVDSIFNVYSFWHSLVKLKNKSKLLKRSSGSIATVQLAEETLLAIRYELFEQHMINLIRLNQSKNAFSEFLKNSLMEEKGALYKLNNYLAQGSHNNMALKCFEKYPDIQRMSRAELSFDQIILLEIKNYIRYFDYKTDELMWMKAKLLLSVLAYYQLFLKHLKKLPNNIQATTAAYMATAENTMDYVAGQNNVKEIRSRFEEVIFDLHVAKNELFQEEILDYQESKEPIQKFLLETHNQVLNVLLENDEFIAKLKDIYIDRERLSNIFPQNSKTFKQLIAGSLENVPTEKDIEAFNLAKIYEDIMIDEKSEFVKDRLTIEASYFYYKILLKDLLSMLNPLKSIKNPKFMRMVIEVEVENAKLEDFLSKLNKMDGKPIKICYLKSFTSSIIGNRAMILENASWKDLLIERNYLNKEIMRDSPNSHIKWVKPECDNQQITAQIVELSISPNYERIHSFVLIDLIQKFPEFLHFVNANAFKFPRLQNLATFDNKNGILLYKKIITETKIAAKSVFYENILAAKLLIQTIKYREQILADDPLINSQSCAKAKAETFAILRIISIYKIGEESEIWRYLCPLEGYLKHLTERTFYLETKWRLNCQCFDQNIDERLHDQRDNFYQKHLELIENHLLDEKVDEKDVLVNVLREQRGTIAKLQSLLFLDGMIKLWENPQIQPKLLNKAFFRNKKWLLSHYIGTLTATSTVVKQNERIAADLFVFAIHFYDEKKLDNMNKFMHELMNKLWLYVRISYDMCNIEREKTNSLSLKLRNFIPKIYQLILMDKNGVSKLKVILNKIKKMAFADEEKQEIETNENAATDKTIQKLHFQMLEKITANEKHDEQLITPFNQLIEQLNGDIEKRRNFLQFLDLEDLKKFFRTAGISYNSLEFSTNLLDDPISQETNENEDNNQLEIDEKSTNSLDFEETESASINSPLTNDRLSEDGTECEEKDESNNETETPILSNEKITSTNKNVEIKKGNKKITNFPNFLTKANAENLDFKKISDAIIPSKVFVDDNALYERYKTIAQTKPSKEKQIILIIGTLVNEIENLSKMVQHLLNFNFLQYFNDRKRVENLVQLWTIIKQVSFTLKIDNFENLQAYVNKLFHFLYDILSHLDGYNYLGQMSDLEIFEIEKYHLLEQIHVRKFAFSLINDAKCMTHDADIKKKLYKILGTKFSPIHFEHLETDWNKMVEQIEIDAELYRKHFMFDILPNSLMMPTFPKISQQQITDSYKRNEMSLTRELKNYMFNGIYEKSSLKSKEQFDHRIQLALIKIYSMVKDWSKERAQLLVSGSFLLGANAFDSDIDLICVVPEKTIPKSEFFGNNETFCQQNKCSVQEKASFYCQLCENENVTNLVKITYGTVMIIKFKFDQIDFDMPFVQIPYRKSLPKKITDENLQNSMKNFDILNVEHKKMLKTLSGYRSILYIKNLLDMQNNGDWDQILSQDKNNQKINQPKKKAANFRLLLLALKLWAKNNYIYSNKFGYLNGVILTIMVTKIVLLYPNSTIPFLMEKFFLFYATRPFQVPIQLNKNSVESMANDPFFVQNPMEQQMAVITPAFPLQNASKMVTHSTAKIIRRELIEGLNRIRAMKMENNFDWAKLLNHSVPFLDKYDQFIVINCMAESSVGGDNFCQFVDGRIRLQIVDSIDVENKENNVVETQLFPDVYRHDCLLSKQFVKTSFRTNVCKMWIVGIKLGQNIVTINSLLDKFDQTIKKHYLKYNPIDVKNFVDIKNYFKKLDECNIATEIGKLKVELKSILVTRHELIARDANIFY